MLYSTMNRNLYNVQRPAAKAATATWLCPCTIKDEPKFSRPSASNFASAQRASSAANSSKRRTPMMYKLMAAALWVFVAAALLGAQQAQAQLDPRVTNISITATPSGADRILSDTFARNTATYTEILSSEVTMLTLSVAVADVHQAVVSRSVGGNNTDLWDTGGFQNPFSRSQNINIPLVDDLEFMRITVVINRYDQDSAKYLVVATYTIDIHRLIWCADEDFDPNFPVATAYMDSDSVPQWADIDKDDDGLIEICDLEGLDKVRYASDGSGYQANASAAKLTSGCASGGCRGYELVRHLDFLDDNSYRSTANKVLYTEGEGWRPMGRTQSGFVLVFDGNRYTIANLRINRPGTRDVGLFSNITFRDVRNIGLVNVDITGGREVGSMAGTLTFLRGEVSDCDHCYVVGGTIRGTRSVGGLIGNLSGRVGTELKTSNYTNVAVVGTNEVGGLVGHVSGFRSISNFSYAAGTVTGSDKVGGFVGDTGTALITRYHGNYSTARVTGDSNVGGFAGFIDTTQAMPTFENNYWDLDTSGQRSSVGEGPGAITSLSTVQMLAPTAPGTMATDAYYNWDTTRWDFGTDKQYPALKYTTANTVLGQSVGDLLPFQRNKLQSLMLKANGAGDDLISNFSPHRMEYVVELAVKPNTVTLELTADEERHIVNVVDAEGNIIRETGNIYTVPVDAEAEETLIQVSVRNPSDPIEWFETQYSVRVMSTISGELSELELEIEEGTTQTVDVAAEDKSYTLEVGYAVESIKLTPRAAAGARISLIVGDTTTQVVVSGEAQTIPLPLGETTLIRIEVEGSVESTTYLLSVFRSTAAVLSELALSVGDLDFAAEVDAYTVAVANTVTSVAVMTATALDSQAMVAIYRGTDRVSLGTPVELAEGATIELRIEVNLGDLMRTYTVSVMRAPSANADLAEGDGLVLTGATLQPSFEPTHTIYTASVLAVDSVVVSAKAAHSSATIVVRKDSTEVEADNSENYVIELTLGGSTAIAVKVTAQDQSSSKTYLITVTHDRGSGTSLTQVILRNADVGLEIDLSSFYSDESAYTTTVEAVLDLTLNLAASIGATLGVTQGGTPITADEDGDYPLSLLAGGSIALTIKVTAGDESAFVDYTLNIVHRISSQALLRSLELRRGDGAALPLIPPFEVPDSASAETSLSFDYEASVEGYRQLEMEFSLSLGATAAVSADGGMIAETDEDLVYTIDLPLGETTTITIVVISQDEKRQTTYTLMIRHEVDEETGLQSLRVVDLAGDAVVLTTHSEVLYDASVSKETQVDVLVEASGVEAELLVTVAEETLVGENGRYAVDLTVATTTVLVIEVTAQNGSRASYTIRFKQEADGDANLRKLEVRDNLGNALRLVPAFMAEEVAYQSTLSGATHVRVRAAVAALRSAREGGQIAVATLRVNGMPLADDTPSELLELDLGTTTTVVIEVSAQDGTTKAYVVAIAQVRSTEADLTALSLVDDLEDLVELADFDADREQYEIELVGTTKLRLMPRASAGANIVVRAAGASMPVRDGMSPAIELNLAGVTTITIVVTAQDESSSKTYILIISQIKNDEALLDGLSLRAGGMALQLVPKFSTATLSYATTVTAFESVLVMPRASLGAHIMISSSEASTSVEVMNNQASAPIDLRLGATTTLVIRVTSQDESSTTAYSVAIRHYLGRDAILESLEFEPPGNSMPLTPEFASRHTTYTIAYFDLDATHLRLSASVGAKVVLRVNGEELAPQEQLGTYLIDLTRAQEIVIMVRAQAVAVGGEDGVVGETQNTYMIMLSRTTSGLLIRTRLFLEAPLQ